MSMTGRGKSLTGGFELAISYITGRKPIHQWLMGRRFYEATWFSI